MLNKFKNQMYSYWFKLCTITAYNYCTELLTPTEKRAIKYKLKSVRFKRSKMTYYNTFIWMVTIILVIVGLSIAVSTEDEKDLLKQKLLDKFEYGSTSAVPTDNEMDLSKLKLEDEFNSGSLSVESTDNKMELIKQELIDEYNYLQSLNRRIFASPQKHITELGIFDEQGIRYGKAVDILFKTSHELDCNYTYDILVFMKLMTPDNYTNERLYKNVDHACSNWAQHMLNARINSGFQLRKFPYTSWLIYFYMKIMKIFFKRGENKEMNKLYDNIRTHLNKEMRVCKYVWPKNYKYDSYEDELKSLEPNSAFEKLTEACTHLRTMSESKPHLNFDLDSSLYINNVTEDIVLMNTLITGFGGLDGGQILVSRLIGSMNAAKNPKSSLSDWIHSLNNVHCYFLRIVKTIMLRLWWAFLENLKTVKNSQSAEQIHSLLYNQHLNDFANLLKLNKDDDLMKLIKYKQEDDLTKLITNILPSFNRTIEDKMSKISSLLKKYDTKNSGLYFWNHEPKLLKTVACQTSRLEEIAKSIGYSIDIRSLLRESILCVEVFVEYLKNKLSDVNFNILLLFEAFHEKVRENSFVR